MPDANVAPEGSNGTLNTGSDTSTLPQWARDKISELNNEDGAKRIKIRELTDAHTAAMAQVTALTAEKDGLADGKTKAETDLLKLSVALAAGIPGDKAAVFAARLNGATEAELKADAETLVGAFGTQVTPPATDPSQGRGADNAPTTPQSAFGLMLAEQLDGVLKK